MGVHACSRCWRNMERMQRQTDLVEGRAGRSNGAGALEVVLGRPRMPSDQRIRGLKSYARRSDDRAVDHATR